jgi:hypothetical protein
MAGLVPAIFVLSNSPPSLALRRGKPTLRRPYSLRRRVRRSSAFALRASADKPLSPPRDMRGDGAPSGASLFNPRLVAWAHLAQVRAPLGAPSRLFCPRVRVSRSASLSFFGLRRAGSTPERALALELPRRPCPASSSRRGHSAPRSGPEASRVRGYEPRPQAPHQPMSGLPDIGPERAMPVLRHRPFRGSIFETSREDALSRARRNGI